MKLFYVKYIIFIYHYLFKCFFFVSGRFLYTCKFEFENYSGIELLELLIATDELGLESLYEYMMEYFIENCEKYIKENAVKILQSIYKSEKFKELKNIYLEKFCDYYSEKLFESNNFESLEKLALLEVIKRDDFDADEIVIWEKILKWGLARHPEVHIINVKHWTSQDFLNLGNTLKEFLYLIRYQDISNEDFFEKIVPYQMLFPKTLWDNVI